jgi:ATP-dependent Clp protease adaptor protein ClpS
LNTPEVQVELGSMVEVDTISEVLHDPDTQQDTLTKADEFIEPWAKVFIHNDDVTPYDFVVVILQRFFDLDRIQAEQVTYIAHISGIAYVTTLPRAEAERRVGQAHFAAGLEGYPLTFTVEPG